MNLIGSSVMHRAQVGGKVTDLEFCDVMGRKTRDGGRKDGAPSRGRIPKELPFDEEVQSTTDQFQFVPDEVNVIIHECIEKVLGGQKWDVSKQEQWNNKIMECILGKMSEFKKPYKYIVQCTTVQRTGSCIDVANACYWDTEADGSVTVRWENPDIYAIVSLFGIFI